MMRTPGRGGRLLALAGSVLLVAGCAASLRNYEGVTLGMSPEQVLQVAGKPHRVFRMESTGQGTLIPTPAGKTETWFYRGGIVQFTDGRVVAKGQRVSP